MKDDRLIIDWEDPDWTPDEIEPAKPVPFNRSYKQWPRQDTTALRRAFWRGAIVGATLTLLIATAWSFVL